MNEATTGWQDLTLGGLRCQIYEPRDTQPTGGVVILLHDDTPCDLPRQPVITTQLERHGLRLVAPESRDVWWTDRIYPPMDPERSAAALVAGPLLESITARWDQESLQVALWGWGRGGQGALRLAYTRPNEFPIAAAIAPLVDAHTWMEQGDVVLRQLYRDPEQARQDTVTLHIHPLNWPRHQWFCCDPTDYAVFEGVDRLQMKLYSLGVPHECDLQTVAARDGSSYVDQMTVPALAFIAQRTEQERRRVPG
jgi:hypothetical protein